MNDNDNIITYLALVAAVFAASTQANIDAIEDFEAAHPGIEDDVYQAAGPGSWNIITGRVMPSLRQL